MAAHAPLFVHSLHPPLIVTQHIHEYHVDIPWVSMPSLGFRHDSTIAKKEVYDVFILFYMICYAMLWYAAPLGDTSSN
jgi:hypothetical protein